jgi:hypothetical protein
MAAAAFALASCRSAIESPAFPSPTAQPQAEAIGADTPRLLEARQIGEYTLASPALQGHRMYGWQFDLDGRLWVVEPEFGRLHRYDPRAGSHTEIYVDATGLPRSERETPFRSFTLLANGGCHAGAAGCDAALYISAGNDCAHFDPLPLDGSVESGGQRLAWERHRLRAFDSDGTPRWTTWAQPLEAPWLRLYGATRLDSGEWLVDELRSSRDRSDSLHVFEVPDSPLERRSYDDQGRRGEAYALRAGRSGRWSLELLGEASPARGLVLRERATGAEFHLLDLAQWNWAPHGRWSDVDGEVCIAPDGRELWRLDRRHWKIVRFALPER